ncbi:hypothetical protein [Croceicoccus sediminis]|uniref:hypothetical protein n=1 Tax=Croceicoccus sediminis TaxID=2571150 RepID=UPI001184052F|nr:hypothetical protein [Croceicoccus sediminis]
MDHADEIRRLGAENVALQTLVIGLMHALSESGRGGIAADAFEKADQAMEIAILSLGDRASPEYVRHAMESLEQMRRMAFPQRPAQDG